MTISSRNPEGIPHRFPICGNAAALDPSFPGGDCVCPRCGHLLWWFRDRLAGLSGFDAERIRLESLFREGLGADSLDLVEFLMEFEEEFGVIRSDEDLARLRTLADLRRLIIQDRGESA